MAIIKIVPMPGPAGLGTSGDITFDGVQIIGAGTASGDGYENGTIELVPDINLETDQYLVIDPTSPNHIHIRAGGEQDESTAQLTLGGEQANVAITDYNHQVYVNTWDSVNEDSYSWIFGNDGVLSGPAMGSLWVEGISGKSEENALYITSADSILLDSTNGQFLNDVSIEDNQIATLGDVADVTSNGATGSFISQDGKTVTVTNGIITSIEVI